MAERGQATGSLSARSPAPAPETALPSAQGTAPASASGTAPQTPSIGSSEIGACPAGATALRVELAWVPASAGTDATGGSHLPADTDATAGSNPPAGDVRLEALCVPQDCDVAGVLSAAMRAGLFPGGLPADVTAAVFGRRVAADARVRDGDRIELLGPLRVDPKVARMRRVAHKRAASPGGKWNRDG